MTAGLSPPGSGLWTRDAGRFPRPPTRFTAELFPGPVARGFGAATRPYGLLLDRVEWAFVSGWGYLRFRRVAPLLGDERLDRQGWEARLRSSAALAARLVVSGRVFERRPWRAELAAWDGRVKPALVAVQRRLGAVDPESLAPADLLAHLARVRRQLRWALYVHHRFNVTPTIPVGHLLAAAEEWTGRPAAGLLARLEGAGTRSVAITREHRELAAALRTDGVAAGVLAGAGDAAAVLHDLRTVPGPTGRAVGDYLAVVGWWTTSAGADVGDPCLLETPALLVEALRAGVRAPAADGAAVADAAAEVRADVPAARRREFDALLAEARAVHRLRDERALYADVWATGLVRRALLAGGRGLADGGALVEPEDLTEAGSAEVRSLLAGGPGPGGEELATRARHRRATRPEDVPATLGGPPPAPIPLEWLPVDARRTERAFRTYLRALEDQGGEDAGGPGGVVGGVPASPGVYEGRARVVRGPSELVRLEAGDVLVCSTTSPAHNLAMALVGAVVTDGGGLLSHAAIVARDYAIPAVVGCGDATTRIPDGARVRVDGSAGQVTVVARS